MRISGITIPDKKRLEVGLTYVYGIGRTRAHTILKKAGVGLDVCTKDLSSEEEGKIRQHVEEFIIEGELKRTISGHIKRLKDIKCYRGVRHTKRLPVRGQRTKANSRTVRGNVRRTMGSGKRRLEKT